MLARAELVACPSYLAQSAQTLSQSACFIIIVLPGYEQEAHLVRAETLLPVVQVSWLVESICSRKKQPMDNFLFL